MPYDNAQGPDWDGREASAPQGTGADVLPARADAPAREREKPRYSPDEAPRAVPENDKPDGKSGDDGSGNDQKKRRSPVPLVRFAIARK